MHKNISNTIYRSNAQRLGEMRLHYYTTAVPNSYCVGVHNGHGFGSLFARIFSKVAARTAARVVGRVAKTVGTKVLKTAVRRGVPLLRKVKPLIKKSVEKGLEKGIEIGGEYVINKLERGADAVLKNHVPPETLQKAKATIREGVGRAQKKITDITERGVETLIDKSTAKINQLERKGGVKRKNPSKSPVARKKLRPGERKTKKFSIDRLMDEAG